MATTKIWPVKDSLARVVDYAQNPNKTIYSDLQQVLHYAANEEKTLPAGDIRTKTGRTVWPDAPASSFPVQSPAPGWLSFSFCRSF